MKRILTWGLCVLAGALCVVSLTLTVRHGAGEHRRPDQAVSVLNPIQRSVNGEPPQSVVLPVDVRLNRGDVTTLTGVVPDGYDQGAVLCFLVDAQKVQVEMDGKTLYQLDASDRSLLVRNWCVIDLPAGCGKKTLRIRLQKVEDWPHYALDSLYELMIAPTWEALRTHLVQVYGGRALAALLSLLLGAAMVLAVLVLVRSKHGSRKLIFYLLIFVGFSLWGLTDNPLTPALLGYAPFFRKLSFLIETSFLIPVMLYFGECYRGAHRLLMRRAVLVSIAAASLLVVSDLLDLRTLFENLMCIHMLMVLQSALVVGVIIRELSRGERSDLLTSIGALILAGFGLLEIARMVLFEQTATSIGLYWAVPIAMVLGAAQGIYAYLNEVESAETLRIREKEITRVMDIQKDYQLRITSQIGLTRRVMHDFNHYVALLNGVAKLGSEERMAHLLEHAQHMQQDMRMRLYSDNLELNSILSYAGERCEREGIRFDVSAQLPDRLPAIYDLCIVLGNLLDNACEAAQQADGERFVIVRIGASGDSLLIRVENSCKRGVSLSDTPKTVKTEFGARGLGLLIVREILAKHGGELVLESCDLKVKASALFPLERTS